MKAERPLLIPNGLQESTHFLFRPLWLATGSEATAFSGRVNLAGLDR